MPLPKKVGGPGAQSSPGKKMLDATQILGAKSHSAVAKMAKMRESGRDKNLDSRAQHLQTQSKGTESFSKVDRGKTQAHQYGGNHGSDQPGAPTPHKKPYPKPNHRPNRKNRPNRSGPSQPSRPQKSGPKPAYQSLHGKPTQGPFKPVTPRPLDHSRVSVGDFLAAANRHANSKHAGNSTTDQLHQSRPSADPHHETNPGYHDDPYRKVNCQNVVKATQNWWHGDNDIAFPTNTEMFSEKNWRDRMAQSFGVPSDQWRKVDGYHDIASILDKPGSQGVVFGQRATIGPNGPIRTSAHVFNAFHDSSNGGVAYVDGQNEKPQYAQMENFHEMEFLPTNPGKAP